MENQFILGVVLLLGLLLCTKLVCILGDVLQKHFGDDKK